MTEAHKKRLCELAGVKYEQCKYPHSLCYDCAICEADEGMTKITLEILIKAMWAINRERKWFMDMNDKQIRAWILMPTDGAIQCNFKDYNNSEIETLTAALIYVLDNEKC